MCSGIILFGSNIIRIFCYIPNIANEIEMDRGGKTRQNSAEFNFLQTNGRPRSIHASPVQGWGAVMFYFYCGFGQILGLWLRELCQRCFCDNFFYCYFPITIIDINTLVNNYCKKCSFQGIFLWMFRPDLTYFKIRILIRPNTRTPPDPCVTYFEKS